MAARKQATECRPSTGRVVIAGPMWWSSFAARPERAAFPGTRAGGEEELTVVPAEVEERRHNRPHRRRSAERATNRWRFVLGCYDFLSARGESHHQETWDKSVFSLVMLGKMLTGEVPGAIFPDR